LDFPQKFDTLIAHKALNLSPALSGTDKRVGCAIVDHFNRKSGQCDPSIGRIARLLDISPRTVMRAVNRLERLGFIRKHRHGGHFHRNSYRPDWPRFRAEAEKWNARARARKAQPTAKSLSPCQGQTGHLASGQFVTQTLPINQSEETLTASMSSKDPPGSILPIPKKEHSRPDAARRGRVASGSMPPRFRDVANDAAERRWTFELQSRFVSTPTTYAKVIDAITPMMHAAATDAELRKPGAGLFYILHQLRMQNIALSASEAR
jgi:Mn-dependent DtxR family transcriptional regulator